MNKPTFALAAALAAMALSPLDAQVKTDLGRRIISILPKLNLESTEFCGEVAHLTLKAYISAMKDFGAPASPKGGRTIRDETFAGCYCHEEALHVQDGALDAEITLGARLETAIQRAVRVARRAAKSCLENFGVSFEDSEEQEEGCLDYGNGKLLDCK